MINKELTNYIKKKNADGISNDQIRQTLIKQGGWLVEDISEAFDFLKLAGDEIVTPASAQVPAAQPVAPRPIMTRKAPAPAGLPTQAPAPAADAAPGGAPAGLPTGDPATMPRFSQPASPAGRPTSPPPSPAPSPAPSPQAFKSPTPAPAPRPVAPPPPPPPAPSPDGTDVYREPVAAPVQTPRPAPPPPPPPTPQPKPAPPTPKPVIEPKVEAVTKVVQAGSAFMPKPGNIGSLKGLETMPSAPEGSVNTKLQSGRALRNFLLTILLILVLGGVAFGAWYGYNSFVNREAGPVSVAKAIKNSIDAGSYSFDSSFDLIISGEGVPSVAALFEIPGEVPDEIFFNLKYGGDVMRSEDSLGKADVKFAIATNILGEALSIEASEKIIDNDFYIHIDKFNAGSLLPVGFQINDWISFKLNELMTLAGEIDPTTPIYVADAETLIQKRLEIEDYIIANISKTYTEDSRYTEFLDGEEVVMLNLTMNPRGVADISIGLFELYTGISLDLTDAEIQAAIATTPEEFQELQDLIDSTSIVVWIDAKKNVIKEVQIDVSYIDSLSQINVNSEVTSTFADYGKLVEVSAPEASVNLLEFAASITGGTYGVAASEDGSDEMIDDMSSTVDDMQKKTKKKPAVSSADFAQCISATGAKLYGASWSKSTVEQLDLLGIGTSHKIYNECFKKDFAGQDIASDTCEKKDISVYPTWVFVDGSTNAGVASQQRLSTVTGCAL